MLKTSALAILAALVLATGCGGQKSATVVAPTSVSYSVLKAPLAKDSPPGVTEMLKKIKLPTAHVRDSVRSGKVTTYVASTPTVVAQLFVLNGRITAITGSPVSIDAATVLPAGVYVVGQGQFAVAGLVPEGTHNLSVEVDGTRVSPNVVGSAFLVFCKKVTGPLQWTNIDGVTGSVDLVTPHA